MNMESSLSRLSLNSRVVRISSRSLPLRARENDIINPPYPWATNQPCHIHSLEYLHTHGLRTISGVVQCKKCGARQIMVFDLPSKFNEISSFITANRGSMHDRAPMVWMTPEIPVCNCGCEPNFLKPVMPEDKDNINWLFLLLGQMLGFCNLEQLKYFCLRTKNHRTGAKDRVLYLTYLILCKQLDPEGPFNL